MSGAEPTLKDVFGPQRPAASAAAGTALTEGLRIDVKDAKIEPSALVGSVTDSMAGLLDVHLSTVIAGAWAKARVLRQYREKSLAAPGETFLVAMASHSIQSKHHPSIDVLVNGKATDSLPFEIALQLDFEGLVLKVRNGRILEIRPGKCTAGGKIVCRGYPIAEQKSRPFELPGVLGLGDGVEIAE